MFMKNKMLRKTVGILLVLIIALSAGCPKNAGAEEIAKKFIENVEGEQSYMLTHKYLETDELVEVYRDSKGNVKAIQVYADGSKDEVYLIDGQYSVSIEGEITSDYDQDELKTFIDSTLEEAPFYLDDTLEVFDTNIDSDILDVKEDNLYMAVGEYDDGTSYFYSYGKDGTFFEYRDNYDEVRIDLDESILIALP